MGCPSCVSIRDSRFGKGIFATKNLCAGVVVCQATGPLLTFQQTLLLHEKESHCLQIDFNKYILCNSPFLFSNHSCEPNCGVNEHLQMITLRAVAEGEELVWDYSTSMLERYWTMPCNCGALQCRNIVADFDLLPDHVQHDYLQKKIVLPFIVMHLQTFSNTHNHRA